VSILYCARNTPVGEFVHNLDIRIY
jgi:hypothetical protein